MPPDQAAKAWAAAMDPVVNQRMMQGNPRLDLITVPALICASWSDKGLHTRGTFEVFRRIASKDKWLYTHGGGKWDRFYSKDAKSDIQGRPNLSLPFYFHISNHTGGADISSFRGGKSLG